MPLIGYNFSSKNTARVKESIKKIFEITLAALMVVLAIYFGASKQIVRLFMDNDDVVQIGSKFLKGFGLSLPFMCVDFVVVGISQAFGMGRYAFVFSFFRKAVFEIPFILLFSNIFGLFGLAFAACCAEIIMSVIALVVLKKNLLASL